MCGDTSWDREPRMDTKAHLSALGRVERSKSRYWWIVLSGLAMVLVFVSLVVSTKSYTNVAYVCLKTGSQKGHVQWPLGIKTDKWHWESPVERFMERQHSDLLRHEWIEYSGTDANDLHIEGLDRFGRFSSMLVLWDERNETRFERLSAVKKLEFYQVLTTSGSDRVWAIVEQPSDNGQMTQ